MELLIIKCKDGYIRVKDNDYITCTMDKASVFPIQDLDRVKQHVKNLRKRDEQNIQIRTLTIIEGPFREDG